MKHPHTRILVLAVIALLMPIVGGCQASPAFVAGVRNTLPTFAKEIRFYAERDASLDTAARADRLAIADRLDAAVKANPVTLQVVRDAWNEAKPVYTPAIDADDKLTLNEKARRAHNVAAIDTLISEESKRYIYPQTP